MVVKAIGDYLSLYIIVVGIFGTMLVLTKVVLILGNIFFVFFGRMCTPFF